MAVRTSAIDVVIRMRGQRAFAATPRAATAELEAMGVKGARALGGIARAGAKMQALGSSMTRHMTVPIAAGLGYATYKAINFNKQMELIATQAGGSQKEVANLSNQVVKLAESGKVGVTPDQMAQGLYHIESQGYRSSQAMDVLKASIDGAEVGQADLNDTAKVLGQTMNVFGLSADHARSVMSQFNSIVGHGDMTLQDLLSALSTGVLPQAKNFGLTLADVGGALDTMTSRTFPAARAGTALKMALTALAAPTDATKKNLADLGINAVTLSQTLSRQGLPAALQYMKDQIDASGISAHNAGVKLSQAFGGGRTGPGVLTLIDNISALRKNVQGAGADVDSFDKKVALWAGTSAAQLDRAKAQLEGVSIALGTSIAPTVADLANKLGDLLRWFGKLPAPIQNTVVEFLVLAAVLGPLIWAFGTLAKLALPLMNFVIWLKTVFGPALASAARTAGQTAGVSLTEGLLIGFALAIPFIAQELLNKLTSALGLSMNAVGDWFAGLGNDVFGKFINSAKDDFKALGGWVGSLAKDIARQAVGIFNALKNAIKDALQWVKNAISNVIDAYNSVPLLPNVNNPFELDPSQRKGPAGPSGPALPGPAGPGGPLSARRHHRRALGGPIVPGGTALVGERGPELAQFPFGAQIFSNDATKKLLSSNRNDSTIVIPVHLNGRVIAEEVVRAGESARARK